MNDENIDITLGLFLDGELSAPEEAEVRKRLAEDSAWQERLERLQRASRELQSFYSESEMEGAANEAEQEIIVERIVRESTMEARRSTLLRKKPSPILLGAIGIVILAAGFLVVRRIQAAEPDAGELVERAGVQLKDRFVEAEVKLPSSLRFIEELGAASGMLSRARCVLRFGPGGLFSLSVSDVDTGEAWTKFGYTGEQAYLWRQNEGKLRILDKNKLTESSLVRLAHSGWEAVLMGLEEAKQHPEALELVGKVQGTAEETLWKVRLGGPQVSGRARYWFDGDGNLRRIAAAGLEFVIHPEVKLSPGDFSLETVLPGVPVEGGEDQ